MSNFIIYLSSFLFLTFSYLSSFAADTADTIIITDSPAKKTRRLEGNAHQTENSGLSSDIRRQLRQTTLDGSPYNPPRKALGGLASNSSNLLPVKCSKKWYQKSDTQNWVLKLDKGQFATIIPKSSTLIFGSGDKATHYPISSTIAGKFLAGDLLKQRRLAKRKKINSLLIIFLQSRVYEMYSTLFR